jgi:phosphinothricin acetyltransferase
MSGELIVRPAQGGDLAALAAIYDRYIRRSIVTFDTEPTTVESRTSWFERFSGAGPHRLLVACEGERVLGCAASGPYRRHPAFAQTVEVSVYLHPDARSRGVGSALYRVLLELLQSEEVHVALAGIALPNDASVALHLKFGFREVGIFDEYAVKHGTYISSMWMQRRI